MEVPASTKFTWKIDNFSQLTKRKLHSDIFIAGRCKWRVLIFPKGNNVFDNLSIYLAIADPMNLPHGWSRDADFSLSVINQFNNRLTVIKDVKHVFNEKTSF
ncbi:ubiquitin C-terminal hydrolase 13-like [Mercurialis annua]|uniref:ubiquitin C-terminal hydrolase 13-like n=1 Tax=Mercurialis annua TaxID=3986 RepID=UPI00215E2BB6|nr:ubiquitin C-terminal hydrolase 13-like [Mercurialis annua]